MLAAETDGSRQRKIECLLNNLPSIRLLNICVASFSADGDSLNQWRAYSKDIGGYAVGFDSTALLARAEEQGFALLRCEYEEDRQRMLVRQLVEESLSQDFNMVPGIPRSGTPENNCGPENRWRFYGKPCEARTVDQEQRIPGRKGMAASLHARHHQRKTVISSESFDAYAIFQVSAGQRA
jgi:hypothetical protein